MISICLLLGAQLLMQMTAPSGAERNDNRWPQRLAGRDLIITTNRYALYWPIIPSSNNSDSMDNKYTLSDRSILSLNDWLNKEFAILALTYKIEGQGVILVINKEEPCEKLALWKQQHITRNRQIYWSSPIRQQNVASKGRPYCFIQECYYTESYILPYDAAIEIGIYDVNMPMPKWIIIISTDDALKYAFTNKYDKYVNDGINEYRSDGDSSIGHALMGMGIIMSLKAFKSKYESIDIKLMHLQRRETLETAIIMSHISDDNDAQERIAVLRKSIDNQWKKIYFSRPIE